MLFCRHLLLIQHAVVEKNNPIFLFSFGCWQSNCTESVIIAEKFRAALGKPYVLEFKQ
jgi:hypothetical protein